MTYGRIARVRIARGRIARGRIAEIAAGRMPVPVRMPVRASAHEEQVGRRMCDHDPASIGGADAVYGSAMTSAIAKPSYPLLPTV